MKNSLLILSFLVLINSIIFGQNIDEGLLAHFPFNGNAIDESGNGHDGSVFGATLTDDRFGIQNSAYYFDGIDDYIDIGRSVDSSRSISFWFKPNSVIDGTNNRTSLIVRNTGNEYDELTIYFEDQPGFKGKAVFSRRLDHSPHGIASNDSVWQNRWYHVATVIDPKNGMKLYIDGNLQVDTELSTDPVPPREEYTALGRWGDSGNRYFNGAIDDIHIYNFALSTIDISALSEITSIEYISRQYPSKFEVFQNYPNPFNPATTIKYILNSRSFIEIYIYNILGQRVTTLVRAQQTPGIYEIIWDGKNDLYEVLPSGNYYYQIKTEDYSRTKKMLLLR